MGIATKDHIKNDVLRVLHILVLLGAVGLIVLISYDCFRNISFLANENYMTIQFWICVLFILDVIVEFFLASDRWRYFYTHLFALFVCIPYLNIIHYFGISLSPEMQYLIRFIPMIRAAYVFTLVLSALSTDRVSSLFSAYIGLLIATVYFASMMFFIEEHYINTGVPTYWSALWWSAMNLTTVGCDISPITPVGKIINVFLPISGMVMFPLVTVYLTNYVTRKSKEHRPV